MMGVNIDRASKDAQPAGSIYSICRLHDDGESPSAEKATNRPAILLPRKTYILWLTIIYAALFIGAWFVLAYTSLRPFGLSSYDSRFAFMDNLDTRLSRVTRSIEYAADAQLVMTIVAVLTVPLTSIVLASAAVPWLQQSGHGMNLRQVMTLADRGWTSPYIYTRLLTPSGWKRYGSSFIALAILLNALGAPLPPIINRLSRTKTVKFPTIPIAINTLSTANELLIGPGNYFELLNPLRDRMTSLDQDEFVNLMWQAEPPKCTRTDSTVCHYRDLTYGTISDTYWLAQLPNKFSTGVEPTQYLPRVNSSVSVNSIAQLPNYCSADNSSAWFEYRGSDKDVSGSVKYDYSLIVCIPKYQEYPTFENTDDSQTVPETMFLDVYTNNAEWGSSMTYSGVLEVLVNTTLGWFELPGEYNSNVPGPLLKTFTNEVANPNSPHSRDNSTDYTDSLIVGAGAVPLKRYLPLTNIAWALFGDGSFPTSRDQAYAAYNTSRDDCYEEVPLARFLQSYGYGGFLPPSNRQDLAYKPCQSYEDLHTGSGMHTFLANFVMGPPANLQQALTAAVYVYHDLRFMTAGLHSHSVTYDPGLQVQKPGLTRPSVIALSVLTAVFLVALILLSVYASRSRTWTPTIDSYALLRIGAALGPEALPFVAVDDSDKIVELDRLPGWVGDTAAREEVGRLGIGHGSGQILATKTFEAYAEPDHRTRLGRFTSWLLRRGKRREDLKA